MSEERLKALEIVMELFGISGSPRIAATEWIIKEALRYVEEKWNAETRCTDIILTIATIFFFVF